MRALGVTRIVEVAAISALRVGPLAGRFLEELHLIRVFVVQQDDAGGRLGNEAAELFLQNALFGSKLLNLLLYPVPERDVALAMDDAFENRLHGIEILLGNGVELMVVAAGAPNR